MARYALVSMSYEKAGEALLNGLNKVSEPLKVGIIDSLGDMQYKRAVPDLITLLDVVSINNATRALGLIGTPEADQLIPRLSKTTGKACKSPLRHY